MNTQDDTAILDWLSAGTPYIETDEPDGYIAYDRDRGQWKVVTRKSPSKSLMGRGWYDSLREALLAARDPNLAERISLEVE